jgi:hypothetical protein
MDNYEGTLKKLYLAKVYPIKDLPTRYYRGNNIPSFVLAN